MLSYKSWSALKEGILDDERDLIRIMLAYAQEHGMFYDKSDGFMYLSKKEATEEDPSVNIYVKNAGPRGVIKVEGYHHADDKFADRDIDFEHVKDVQDEIEEALDSIIRQFKSPTERARFKRRNELR